MNKPSKKELNDLIGFNRNIYLTKSVRVAQNRISEVRLKMRTIRAELLNSNMLDSSKINEWDMLNDKLKEYKIKETELVYLRNKL